MTVFISGGCKNGKSTLAQKITKKLGEPLYYMATMIPSDEEDRERIRRHLSEREGWGFTTLECGAGMESEIKNADLNGSFLFDSVTAMLLNEMFPAVHGYNLDKNAVQRCEKDLLFLIKNIKNIVFVSDFIYSDAIIYDITTEEYRRGLAYLDKMLAEKCDTVLELCSGLIIIHKGENFF